MLCDALQDVSQVVFRIKVIELRGAQDRVDGGGALTAVIRSGEQPEFFRPKATARNARSAGLLSISKRPSSR